MTSLELATNSFLVLLSILFLWKGADFLVDAATKIARSLGVSDLVIGLTVVSFGTSAPEFAVTIYSAIQGQGDISIGNVIGSNIFNLGFILGGCAALIGFKTTKTLVYRDGLFLISVTIILRLLLQDRYFDQLNGAILLSLLIGYISFLYMQKEPVGDGEELAEGKADWKDWLWLFIGVAVVVGGGHLMVEAASKIARHFGLSDWVIGVTICAAGTSMPEFATSIVAVSRGQHGLSIGNLIGSDLFNILGVLGVAGLIHPMEVDPAALGSTTLLIGMVSLVVLFMRTGWAVSRLEGAILVVINLVRWVHDFTSRGG